MRAFSLWSIHVFLIIAALCGGAGAETLSISGKNVRVTIDAASGQYSIELKSPAWTFSGSVDQTLTEVNPHSGADKLGAFSAITFNFQAEGAKTGEIRTYPDRALVQFILTCNSAQAKSPQAFPVLQPPKGLHLFSYDDVNFAHPHFDGKSGGSPWLMFDDQAHAAILSPASHFMIANVHAADDADENLRIAEGKRSMDHPRRLTNAPIASGLMSELRDVPQGFSHSTILAFGDGINATWNAWGKSLTDLSGKSRPPNDADPSLKYFGYWTDNGANYYYNYDQKLGYAPTLEAVVAKFRSLNIPLEYLQLDSWWYSKSFTGPDGKEGPPFKVESLPRGAWNAYGGLLEYRAHKDLFPDGLNAFHEKVGLPLITHNRWMDPKSPYHERYKIAGLAAIDPMFWDEVAGYLKSCGVITYEQDWLDRIFKYSPELQSSPTAADAFMDGMAHGMEARGLTMQYCMAQPRHYLQGSRYANLTSVRVSDDRFGRDRWAPALYVSQMASAMGEWPWVDTFDSHETPNLLLANLSAGVVGVGDAIDKIDAANIRKVIRADGVIVKPDTPITPIDQSVINDANGTEAPMIAGAYTNFDSIRAAYVFAYPRSAKQLQLMLRNADVGVVGDAIVFDHVSGIAKTVPAGKTFDVTFKDESDWAYFVVVPLFPAQWDPKLGIHVT